MLAICGGLMRTGSVAMFQVMRELVQSERIGYAPSFPLNQEIQHWYHNVSSWAKTDDLVVTKLHRWDDFLDPYAEYLKVVMTVRDMRDVVVSLMNFRNGTFESSLNSAAFEGNLREQSRWKRKAGVERIIQIPYEDFVRNRADTTRSVARFLGIDISLERAFQIEQKWNINRNLGRALAEYPTDHPDFMSHRHIQSGKVDQWKTALTPEQIVQVQDRVGHEWFYANGYELYS